MALRKRAGRATSRKSAAKAKSRDRRFLISMTESEYAALKKAAARDDRPVAVFARRLLLRGLKGAR